MRVIKADLHIHSALSPCADDAMTPELIVYAAIAAELDLIAICDHNCAGNVEAVRQASDHIAGKYLHVIPGMEITTREEVHVLGLFPEGEQAIRASETLATYLPEAGPGGNPLGSQPLMDYTGRIIGSVDRLLSFASTLSLAETITFIRDFQGLAIAAHVDRPSFSVISQLGFLPDDVRFDALEISAAGCARGEQQRFSSEGYTLITTSDAHFLMNIGCAHTCFLLKNPEFNEIKQALHRQGGRECYLA